MIYADVVIDITSGELDRSFSYRVPAGWEDKIGVGMSVTVPFGKGNRPRKGYVTGLSDKTDYEEQRVKSILTVDSSAETTEANLLKVAAWIRETYGSTVIQSLRTVFPVREKMKIRVKKRIVLKTGPEEAEQLLCELQKGRGKARARLLGAVLESEEKEIDYAYASKELGTTESVLRYFQENGILRVDSEESYRLPFRIEDIPQEKPALLNDEQKEAVSAIRSEWNGDQSRPVLIHGVTGSGKTEVYMTLIQDILDRGKQVIVLIPEISLTYQTVRRFVGRFGSKVSILNSRLSRGERYDRFVQAKKGEISVMVGPRSALFTPFTNLGLIIIDEEHEAAYKSESTPRYHARETAVFRAELEGAHVVFGSATPSLEAYSRALSGEYRLVRLTERHEGRPLPDVYVTDLREELKKGNRSILSRRLRDEMEDRLLKHEQIMLFLNRRGFAGFVSCRECGHVIKCPHCDVSLSQHMGGRLVCHYCGYETQSPKVCPECGSSYISGFKAGTQQAEQVISRFFPEARILRMDSDTTRTKGSYEAILSSFAAHEADILIGTQMIVKGHDFPAVTLVGILAADLSLNASDFRSAERTFQLLTQAVGRAGRGVRTGSAVLQTYCPSHYSIQTAARQDYEAFYREEMAYRSLMDYPPAAHLLVVHASCRNEEKLTQGMYYAARFCTKLSAAYQIRTIGPAPEQISKVKDMYRQALYLKGKDDAALKTLRKHLEDYIAINPGFRDIYMQYDHY